MLHQGPGIHTPDGRGCVRIRGEVWTPCGVTSEGSSARSEFSFPQFGVSFFGNRKDLGWRLVGPCLARQLYFNVAADEERANTHGSPTKARFQYLVPDPHAEL